MADDALKPSKQPTFDFNLEEVMGVNKNWPFPAEKDGWMMIHNALRAAMSDTKTAVDTLIGLVSKDRQLSQWQVDNLHTYWTYFEDMTRHHHEVEEALVFPWIKTRAELPQKMSADHATLMAMLEECGRKVSSIRCTKDTQLELTLLLDFQSVFIEFKKAMEEHLMEEDMEALPLQRAYFSHKELQAVETKILANLSAEQKAFGLARLEQADLESFLGFAGVPRIRCVDNDCQAAHCTRCEEV